MSTVLPRYRQSSSLCSSGACDGTNNPKAKSDTTACGNCNPGGCGIGHSGKHAPDGSWICEWHSCGGSSSSVHYCGISDSTCPALAGTSVVDQGFTHVKELGFKCTDGPDGCDCNPKHCKGGKNNSEVNVTCEYDLGTFKTQTAIDTYTQHFLVEEQLGGPSSNSNKDILNEKILPAFCKLGTNLRDSPDCQAFCATNWNTDAACVKLLEEYCKVDDRALNDDFCYNHCNAADFDGIPNWCDSQIINVCGMVEAKGTIDDIEPFPKSSQFIPVVFLLVLVAAGIIIYFNHQKRIFPK